MLGLLGAAAVNCPNVYEYEGKFNRLFGFVSSRCMIVQVWILGVSLLVALLVLPGEAAKGSLRAGVLSRNSLRRKNSRNYNDGRMDYDGYG